MTTSSSHNQPQLLVGLAHPITLVHHEARRSDIFHLQYWPVLLRLQFVDFYKFLSIKGFIVVQENNPRFMHNFVLSVLLGVDGLGVEEEKRRE